MIVHLEKEEIKQARRRLNGNDVYAVSHDALKARNPEFTLLSPAEIYLSAAELVKVLTGLQDIEVGLTDELDDLQDECASEDEAMLIMTIAALQLRVLSARMLGRDYMPIVYKLIERWCEHDYQIALLGAMAEAEQGRIAAGKKAKLLEFELQALECQEDEAAVQKVLEEFVGLTGAYDVQAIEANKQVLEDLNRAHGHKFDKILENIRRQIEIKSTMCKEFVAIKQVENEIGNIEPGGIGVNKKYGK